MRILDYGIGTAEDPAAYWFEVDASVAPPKVEAFVAVLTEREVLRAMHSASAGEGQDLARQLPLLPRVVRGVWSQGTPCGVKALQELEPRRRAESKPKSLQMPLFQQPTKL